MAYTYTVNIKPYIEINITSISISYVCIVYTTTFLIFFFFVNIITNTSPFLNFVKII